MKMNDQKQLPQTNMRFKVRYFCLQYFYIHYYTTTEIVFLMLKHEAFFTKEKNVTVRRLKTRETPTLQCDTWVTKRMMQD